jgi:alpha amylase-like protein
LARRLLSSKSKQHLALAAERVDMGQQLYPALYQVNTRVWLTELARALNRPATLDDIPNVELDRLAREGFDWVWFLSVWQTGPVGRRISRSNPEWRREFAETLPDLRESDIGGSGFAIASYKVDPELGGEAALARLRERLRARGLRLMLDFVPNHTALDHPWVENHPEYYIDGTEADLARAPNNYAWIKRKKGDLLLAYGRDPYFPGWPDALQLDYSKPATQEAMIDELLEVAGQCDGVRCDMAMLVLPDVFERTWGRRAPLFWPDATRRVREKVPGFLFMAEVYWDLEWTMLQQGFDYAYDKRLYDRLRDGRARPVREHLWADVDYQAKLARFLENHDEPRAAATFAPALREAAAVITYLSPGLRFFHQGQFEGRKKRISPHLVRAPLEETDAALQRFYERLLPVVQQPIVREGAWRLLECSQAWDGNWTWDCFIASLWHLGNRQLLVAVNYAANQSQCFVRIPVSQLAGRTMRFKDLMSPAVFDRDGDELRLHGLYLDMPAGGYHVFEITSL